MPFANKYKGAIIFLCIIIVVSIVLLLVYYALKKEMCNCFGEQDKDDEEGFYDDAERDYYDEYLDLGDETEDEEDEEESLAPTEVLTTEPSLEGSSTVMVDEIPDVVITESEFLPTKKKKSHIQSILKKIKKPIGRVRFQEHRPPTEKTALIETPILPDYSSNHYEHHHNDMQLHPLIRADSMESFMSGLSTVTTCAEEFGEEELPPSRIQVFVEYNPKTWTLRVGCKQAECLITSDKTTMYWQVHMTILPFKKHRFKTRYKSTSTPVFNQTFDVENIAKQALCQLSIRYRVYGRPGRAGRKKLAGEAEVDLGWMLKNQQFLLKEWRKLKRHNLQFIEDYASPVE